MRQTCAARLHLSLSQSTAAEVRKARHLSQLTLLQPPALVPDVTALQPLLQVLQLQLSVFLDWQPSPDTAHCKLVPCKRGVQFRASRWQLKHTTRGNRLGLRRKSCQFLHAQRKPCPSSTDPLRACQPL